MPHQLSRRAFVASSALAGLTLVSSRIRAAASTSKPALLGGSPAVEAPFPGWPVYDQAEIDGLKETLASNGWYRGNGGKVLAFEDAFAELIGARFCIGTSSGTASLIGSLNALGVGPGDEVILPPYTFIACANAILQLGALPVFVDVDPATFLIDPTKIAAAVTERTVAIMPVHIAGAAFDVDGVKQVASEHKLAIVEDACQAVMAEWRGKRVGQFGTTGCFSFQASKNLCAGEGGAILTNDEHLAEKCFAAHNNSRPRNPSGAGKDVRVHGANFRMSEFHAAILMAQMLRLPEQSDRRHDSATYLARQLAEIPGITPMKLTDGCTRSAWHLFPVRYDSEQFAGMSRAKFLEALAAEGVSGSGGYSPLNRDPSIVAGLEMRGFKRSFPGKVLEEWVERTTCPQTDRLCEQAVWFTQNMMLADRAKMDQIADAIRKISSHASELAKG